MTRETKLGLVVSCSFLCLLGTVLFLKLNDGSAVSRSPYAKADGSPPDLPEEPVPIPVTVTPTPPATEAPSALAPPASSSGEARSNPVMALPGTPPPTKFDPNVKPAVATGDGTADGNKDATPPAPTPTSPSTPPAPTPLPDATPPVPTSPVPSPLPAPANPFEAMVPRTPPAAAVKEDTPKPALPTPDGLPRPKSEGATPDAAPTAPPAPDALTPPDSKPPAHEPEPLPGSKADGKNMAPEDKSLGGAEHKKEKEKTATGLPLQPSSEAAEKNNDSRPARPFPSPDPNTAAPAGLPEKPAPTPPAPSSPSGEKSPLPAPVEPSVPGAQGTPQEPAPTTPGGWVVPPSNGSGLPTPRSGLLAPPPRPPSASAASPAPEPVPNAPTSTLPKPNDPAPSASATPPTPASGQTVPPLPAIPLAPASGADAPVPGTGPVPAPSASTAGPGTGVAPLPIPAPNAGTGLPHSDVPSATSPRTATPPSSPTSTADPNVLLGKPMTPARSTDQYAQAPVRPISPIPASPNPLPPLGTPAAGTSPPIAVPMPPGAAPVVAARTTQVESYDEETYVWRANDSFEEVSARFYNSKNYAQALVLFNRNHPRAAAGLAKDPPTLAAGQAMFIPPMRILEKQYPSAIPGYQPVAPAPTPDATRTSSHSLPPSVNLQYRVRQAGEMIPIIARDTLGSSDRWSEIYQLNARSFDPSHPLPVGTVLSMPADARIPPENKP